MQLKYKPRERELMKYLSAYMKDPELNIWHLMILTSILSLGYNQKEWDTIKVSRAKIMSLSHINTLPTYHKYFKELQNLGYIKYTPSYHPGVKVKLNGDPEINGSNFTLMAGNFQKEN